MTTTSPAAAASALAKALSKHKGSLKLHEAFDLSMEAVFCAIRRDEELAAKIRKKLEGRAPDLAVRFIAPLSAAITEHGLGGDILGQVSAEASSLDPRLGQFFTPFPVARLMAAMTIDQEHVRRRHSEEGVVTMHEPAIGSGVMAIAWADTVISLGIPRRDLFIEGWDVEPIAARMAFIQLSLLGIPARVVLGNTLSQEVREVWETPALIVRREAEAVRRGLLKLLWLMEAPDEENGPEDGEDMKPAA